MSNSDSLDAVCARLREARRVIVLSHFNPDADAFGSSCGMALTLRELGKEVWLANETGGEERYAFIPGISELRTELPSDPGSWDAVVACDCGDAGRIGDTFKLELPRFPTLINIDHHVSNKGFGAENLLDFDASSASEIVARVVHGLGVRMTPDIATALLAGIVGDTGSFRYSNTSPSTFRLAAELLEAGARFGQVTRELLGSQSPASVRLQSEALMGLSLSHGGLMAEVVVSLDMIRKNGATPDDADNLVERSRDIRGVKLSVVYKQDPDLWRVSMRSTDERVNVSKIATQFGGGGHVMAAAFRWRRSLDELRDKLRPELESLLKSSGLLTA